MPRNELTRFERIKRNRAIRDSVRYGVDREVLAARYGLGIRTVNNILRKMGTPVMPSLPPLGDLPCPICGTIYHTTRHRLRLTCGDRACRLKLSRRVLMARLAGEKITGVGRRCHQCTMDLSYVDVLYYMDGEVFCGRECVHAMLRSKWETL